MRRSPLFLLQVQTDEGETHIEINRDSDPLELAAEFCERHNMMERVGDLALAIEANKFRILSLHSQAKGIWLPVDCSVSPSAILFREQRPKPSLQQHPLKSKPRISMRTLRRRTWTSQIPRQVDSLPAASRSPRWTTIW